MKVEIVIRKNKDTGMYTCANSGILDLNQWQHVLSLGKWQRRFVRRASCQAHISAGLRACYTLNCNKELSIDQIDVIGLVAEELSKHEIYNHIIKKQLLKLKKLDVPGKIPSIIKREANAKQRTETTTKRKTVK